MAALAAMLSSLRNRAELLVEKAQEASAPLVEKLDRFLFHLFGRLGLRDGGSIKTPGSTVSLIPRYITREQLAAMSKVSDTLQSMQSKKDE